MEAEFLTLNQVAARLSISYDLALKLVHRGKLAAVKVLSVYRVSEESLAEYLRASAVHGPQSIPPLVRRRPSEFIRRL